MRVLVACDWFLKYAADQASALARTGTDVALLCRTHALEFGGSVDEREALLARLADVRVTLLPGRVTSLGTWPDVLRLRRSLRAWQPDIVHAHDNSDPRLLAIVGGLPRVTTIHDPVPHPGQPEQDRLERAIRRRLLTGSAAVVVHGKALVAELPGWARRRRVAVVPHGTTVLALPLPMPTAPAVLLFGRLEPYKGIDILLRAMQRVWNERGDVTLRIAGVGSEAAAIPQDPRIDLRLEYVPESRLGQLFSDATIVVAPYTQASQSGVAALALGYGIPTVVSDVGALRDVAVDGSFVVPPGDDEALSAAILTHLDHDEATRHTVLEFAREHLSWDACARASLELYTTVLEELR